VPEQHLGPALSLDCPKHLTHAPTILFHQRKTVTQAHYIGLHGVVRSSYRESLLCLVEPAQAE
jgi:hypothetical protein